MKKTALFAALLALGTAQADILIDGAASQTLDTVQGGTTDKNMTLTDNGGPGSLASGETWAVQFKVMVNSTSDGLAPAWQDSAESLKIAFIDKSSATTQGGGFELDLVGTPRIRVGYDVATGGAANFNLLSTTGSGLTSGGVTGTTGDLKDVGDVAYFTYTVTNNGTDHDIGVVWSDGAGNETTASYNTTALTVYDSIERMSFRVSDLDGTTQTANLTVEVIPEPATLGLIASVGLGLIGLRRFFMV